MNESQWTPKVGERVVFTYPPLGWQGAAGVVIAIENGAQVVIQFDHDGSTVQVRPWHLQPEPQVAPEAVRQWREEHPPAAADSELARLRALVAKVAALELDAISPVDALSELYELRRDAAAALKGDK